MIFVPKAPDGRQRWAEGNDRAVHFIAADQMQVDSEGHQQRLLLAAMNWMQLAIELTREAMKSSAEPVMRWQSSHFCAESQQEFEATSVRGTL